MRCGLLRALPRIVGNGSKLGAQLGDVDADAWEADHDLDVGVGVVPGGSESDSRDPEGNADPNSKVFTTSLLAGAAIITMLHRTRRAAVLRLRSWGQPETRGTCVSEGVRGGEEEHMRLQLQRATARDRPYKFRQR